MSYNKWIKSLTRDELRALAKEVGYSGSHVRDIRRVLLNQYREEAQKIFEARHGKKEVDRERDQEARSTDEDGEGEGNDSHPTLPTVKYLSYNGTTVPLDENPKPPETWIGDPKEGEGTWTEEPDTWVGDPKEGSTWTEEPDTWTSCNE